MHFFHRLLHEPSAVVFKPFPALFWYSCFRENNRTVIVYSRISGMKKSETVLVRRKQFFLLLEMCTLNCVFSILCASFQYICLAFNGRGKCFASLHQRVRAKA